MEALKTVYIKTPSGAKAISVFLCDILNFDEPIDVLTVSSFYRDYSPTPRTVFEALENHGICMSSLAYNPEIDLRKLSNIWLSAPITAESHIKRIGCVEMSPYHSDRSGWREVGDTMFVYLQNYFKMLDIASSGGIKIDTVALPLLGAGSQKIDPQFLIPPMLSECVTFLKRNPFVKQIYFIERSPGKAFEIASALANSYLLQHEGSSSAARTECARESEKLAFISYSSKDKNIADNLCAKLEQNGIKAWYAPRDIISSDYASAIVNAITKCTHFLVIVSKNSLASPHVLNEIDLAFQELKRNVTIMPLRIDEEAMGPSFTYYLSRQHWMDAQIPPIEDRLNEFVERVKRA